MSEKIKNILLGAFLLLFLGGARDTATNNSLEIIAKALHLLGNGEIDRAKSLLLTEQNQSDPAIQGQIVGLSIIITLAKEQARIHLASDCERAKLHAEKGSKSRTFYDSWRKNFEQTYAELSMELSNLTEKVLKITDFHDMELGLILDLSGLTSGDDRSKLRLGMVKTDSAMQALLKVEELKNIASIVGYFTAQPVAIGQVNVIHGKVDGAVFYNTVGHRLLAMYEYTHSIKILDMAERSFERVRKISGVIQGKTSETYRLDQWIQKIAEMRKDNPLRRWYCSKCQRAFDRSKIVCPFDGTKMQK